MADPTFFPIECHEDRLTRQAEEVDEALFRHFDEEEDSESESPGH